MKNNTASDEGLDSQRASDNEDLSSERSDYLRNSSENDDDITISGDDLEMEVLSIVNSSSSASANYGSCDIEAPSERLTISPN